MNKKHVFLICISILLFSPHLSGESFDLSSTDGKLSVHIQIEETITSTIHHNGKQIMGPSSLSMTIDNERMLGRRPVLLKAKRNHIDEIITPVVPEKRIRIRNHCHELILDFKPDYSLVFRAYDDGIAYRWITAIDGRIKIYSEEAVFTFSENDSVYFPFEENFISHSERLYTFLPVRTINNQQMAPLPVLVDSRKGLKIALTEADLRDYPGMYLTGSEDGSPVLRGMFPHYPLKERQKGDRTILVDERTDYLAETRGSRSFPWRVIVCVENDRDLVGTDIVFRLAKPLQLAETDWIKPGKVAWDWWNAINLWGVDFKSGINTESYRYYIDFASKFNIEYIILDEGWSDPADLFQINPDVDMEELLAYAKAKNVGLILWCVWIALDNRLDEAMDRFEKWGVKGIKVDFMQRDDQKMVNFYHKIAREAAAHHLLVDFHGAYKPTGLRRAYPNVLTREGVRGLEHSKWSNHITPEHDVTLPFIRMLAGPMDYTPGAMINAQEKNFHPVYEKPMSQGTRVHQLSMYVIYESPLQMLSDSPSHYMRDPEVMHFLSSVPTVWDETVVLDGRVSDFVVVARKSGDDWYVGAMTDWTPRILTIDFSFLGQKNYTAEIYADGPNAHRYASDYKKSERALTKDDKLKVELAPGGGWVAHLMKN